MMIVLFIPLSLILYLQESLTLRGWGQEYNMVMHLCAVYRNSKPELSPLVDASSTQAPPSGHVFVIFVVVVT